MLTGLSNNLHMASLSKLPVMGKMFFCLIMHDAMKACTRIFCFTLRPLYFQSKNRKFLLTFIYPCITNITPNYNQRDATFLDLFISTDAVHVLGGSSAHHQEHITVHTASGIVNQ